MKSKKRFQLIMILVLVALVLNACGVKTSMVDNASVDNSTVDNTTPKLGKGIEMRIMPLGDEVTKGFCETKDNCMQ
jgi:hypothetical protein